MYISKGPVFIYHLVKEIETVQTGNPLRLLNRLECTIVIVVLKKKVITHRERSCFCMPCITLDGICENEKIVGKWIVSTLEKRARRRRPNDYAEEIGEQVDDGDQ